MGLFSGPKAGKSSSGNQAYPWLMSSYGGWAPMGTNAMASMSDLLGIGGYGGGGGMAGQTIDMNHDGIPGNAGTTATGTYTIPGDPSGQHGGQGGGADGAFQNYLNSSAYNFVKDEALSGLTNAAAGRGMFRSGATGKALEDRAANIGKTYFDNYLNHLTDVSKLSLGAGGLIGSAGDWSKSKGATAGGQGMDMISAGLQAAALFSDVQLKDNIVDLGYSIGGVPAIAFDYRQDTGIDLPEGRFIGVRAQDVKRLRPDALGPITKGYLTVNYGRLAA